MIRRVLFSSIAALFVALALPLTANAQSIFLLAGPTIPVGDFGDFAELGFFGEAGFTVPVGENGLWTGVSGSHGQIQHDDELGTGFEGFEGRTDVIAAMALLGYDIPTEGSVSPYVWGGAGLLVHRFVPDVGDSESDSNFGYQFGAGLGFGGDDGGVNPFVEARFEGASGTNFVAAAVGVSFPVGGDD